MQRFQQLSCNKNIQYPQRNQWYGKTTDETVVNLYIYLRFKLLVDIMHVMKLHTYPLTYLVIFSAK